MQAKICLSRCARSSSCTLGSVDLLKFLESITLSDVVMLAYLTKIILIYGKENLLMLFLCVKFEYIIKISDELEVKRHLNFDISMSHKYSLIRGISEGGKSLSGM